jgi:hypothetical protein
MTDQRDFFEEDRDLFSQASEEPRESPVAAASDAEAPLYCYDHPYPRFGLAYVLFRQGLSPEDRDVLEEAFQDKEELAPWAAEAIDHELEQFRVKATDSVSDEDTEYEYVPRDELEPSGQTKSGGYYISPHIVTSDGQAPSNLIKKARSFRDRLRAGRALYKKEPLQRSFSPFTAKLNKSKTGYGASTSDPEAPFMQTAFTLVATLTRYKPAAYVPHSPSGKWCNRVIVPDMDLQAMMQFVELFQKLRDSETPDMLIARGGGRPQMHEGNYPGAPPRAGFGPVGLVAAMGRWIQRAGTMQEVGVTWAAKALEALPDRPLYLVSHQKNLFKQVRIGHHVARLSLRHDMVRAVRDLYTRNHEGVYRTRFHNDDHNSYDSNHRQLFYEMAERFLRLYSLPAFRDFLSFRVQYAPSFSVIFEDYFMNTKEQNLSAEVVHSARAYGAYLNEVAYWVGVEAAEETSRSEYEEKARVLVQMESTVWSAKSPDDLFAQLNVQAGRASNNDVDANAERFMEAVHTGEVSLKKAQNLILAYLRLRTPNSNNSSEDDSDDEFM